MLEMSKEISNEDWEKAWEAGKTGFHIEEVHPILKKYLNHIVNGRQGIKIFFPLCGKAVDMKWLADMSQKVVGVEVAAKACQEFFEEQKVEYVTEIRDSFTVYKSKDGLIKLYCGDLFAFNTSYEGELDGYWDRGSLVAINVEDREKYAKLMIDLMAHDARGLLSTVEYDKSKYSGPPHSLSGAEVKDLYGDTCNIEKLWENDVPADKPDPEKERFYEVLFLITKK